MLLFVNVNVQIHLSNSDSLIHFSSLTSDRRNLNTLSWWPQPPCNWVIGHLLPAPGGPALDEVCHKVILPLAVYGGQVAPLGPAVLTAHGDVMIVGHQAVTSALELGPTLGTVHRHLYKRSRIKDTEKLCK